MKILHIYKDYHPVVGGIENHVKMLAEGEAQRGLDVTVLATGADRRTSIENKHGVHVIRAGRLFQLASTPISLSFFDWVRRLTPDVVHLHFPSPPGEAANLWFGKARRTVMTYHSDIVRQRGILKLYRPILRRVLRRADRIIATSLNYVRSSPYLAPVSDKCRVIPLGIDICRFAQPDHQRAEDLRRSRPGPLVLFVGRLRYYKGLEYLLDAMRNINATLLVVGEGPMEAKWRGLTHEYSLDRRVHFVGQVSDNELIDYYTAADLFVLPSSHRSEAFGMVILEAMAAGLPVVSTELGTGTSFVNVDDQTGRVVPARDSGRLETAIHEILTNPDLGRRYGEAARRRAVEFSRENMIDQVIDLYREVLGRPLSTPKERSEAN